MRLSPFKTINPSHPQPLVSSHLFPPSLTHPQLLWFHVFNDKTIFWQTTKYILLFNPCISSSFSCSSAWHFILSPSIAHNNTSSQNTKDFRFHLRINFILFNYKRLFIDGILTRCWSGLNQEGGREAGTSERCSFIVKYTAKVLAVPAMPLQKEEIFLCLAFDWNCILFRGVDFESTLCVSCVQTRKKREKKKQYTAAFLLIFIILLDLFLASWLNMVQKWKKGR